MVEISDEEVQGLFTLGDFHTPIRRELLDALEGRAKTRKELVKELDRPRTTIYDNLVKLQERRLVKKFAGSTNTMGRPKVYWTLTKGEEGL